MSREGKVRREDRQWHCRMPVHETSKSIKTIFTK